MSYIYKSSFIPRYFYYFLLNFWQDLSDATSKTVHITPPQVQYNIKQSACRLGWIRIRIFWKRPNLDPLNLLVIVVLPKI